jgi:hypothetical protein
MSNQWQLSLRPKQPSHFQHPCRDFQSFVSTITRCDITRIVAATIQEKRKSKHYSQSARQSPQRLQGNLKQSQSLSHLVKADLILEQKEKRSSQYQVYDTHGQPVVREILCEESPASEVSSQTD